MIRQQLAVVSRQETRWCQFVDRELTEGKPLGNVRLTLTLESGCLRRINDMINNKGSSHYFDECDLSLQVGAGQPSMTWLPQNGSTIHRRRCHFSTSQIPRSVCRHVTSYTTEKRTAMHLSASGHDGMIRSFEREMAVACVHGMINIDYSLTQAYIFVD